ncbi:MAG: SPOR domain-containing protein [Chitinophagales bacterium]
MKFIFFFSIIVFSIHSFAQDTILKKPVDSNAVIIHKDPRLDLLVKKQAEINEEISRDARRNMKGFRILVINTEKRDEAIAAKAKVYTYFPELKAYLIYQSPYFRLKVGNFKERKDAEDYQKKLSPRFPNGVFIVNDIIEVRPEKDKDTDNNNPDS